MINGSFLPARSSVRARNTTSVDRRVLRVPSRHDQSHDFRDARWSRQPAANAFGGLISPHKIACKLSLPPLLREDPTALIAAVSLHGSGDSCVLGRVMEGSAPAATRRPLRSTYYHPWKPAQYLLMDATEETTSLEQQSAHKNFHKQSMGRT
jgi:hypothetical protein